MGKFFSKYAQLMTHFEKNQIFYCLKYDKKNDVNHLQELKKLLETNFSDLNIILTKNHNEEKKSS